LYFNAIVSIGFLEKKKKKKKKKKKYLFDSNKQQSWQFNTNSNRAGLPENQKVNNAGHP